MLMRAEDLPFGPSDLLARSSGRINEIGTDTN